MSNKKDASGFTPQERHQIIVDYLKEINKPTKVFHLRWKPGELLTGKVLETTPMFWYMKYQWSREQIEAMFFKARIEIDNQFDASLQQVFGGSAGPRWRGGVEIPKQKKWKMRAEENARQWQGQQATDITKDNVTKAVDDYDSKNQSQQQQQSQNDNRMKNKLAQNIGTKNKEIWNAVSDFGADKSIDYKTFSDNLKDRGINVSPLLAKQLFDQLAGPSGKINRQEMDAIVRQLDRVKLPSDFASVTWDDMNGRLGAQLVMKRVLLAAGSGEPFNVDDFIFTSKLNVNISPIQYMNKLTNRDVNWNDRLRAMEELSANIGTNPLFNDVLCSTNIPELLCGWSTQILDNKPEVQKIAIQLLPNIFHTTLYLSQGSPQSTINHLEEILSNLFKVLNDPNARNHNMIKDVINNIINEIIKLNDPESILFLSGILSEKCDLQNITRPQARIFALEQMKKIMFENNNSVPKKGSVKREWLDIAVNKQTSPVPIKRNIIAKYKRRIPPFAVLTSYPKETFPNDIIDFDASKSHDGNHKPCVEFTFDFGDGTENITQKSPLVQHKYAKIGQYNVKCVVKDSSNQTATAMVVQRVININSVKNNVMDNKEENDNKMDISNDLDGLGQQFRVVISNTFGMVFEDHNENISKEGKRLIDVMKQLNPKWINLLDATTKKRYEFAMKPYNDPVNSNKPIHIDSGTADIHEIKNVIDLNIVSEPVPGI
eukprot:417073_1